MITLFLVVTDLLAAMASLLFVLTSVLVMAGGTVWAEQRDRALQAAHRRARIRRLLLRLLFPIDIIHY